ncbi:hypothetical protein [Saliphagus sp. LR7]|uniref:hypothetical protein n=1 Tax=Saliphagus sp. LR7 TaxID=2282654 RepID=UPI000DF72B4C|nr:hypothetical protein [Saliphagus sp. LR7]
MAQDPFRARASGDYTQSQSTRFVGAVGKLAVLLVVLLQTPVVSAHGEAESTALSQSHGLIAIFVGLALVGGAVALE